MYSDLFFVPNSNGSQRRRELIDAACRAHNMKLVHRKRRAAKDRATTSAKSSDGALVPLDKESATTVYNQPFREVAAAVAQSVSVSAYSVSLGPMYPYEDMLATMFAPNLNQAVHFLQFHLVKSWSPTFMLQLQVNNAGRSEFERSLQPRATKWMWLLWTSSRHLFWSSVASVLPLMVRHVPHNQKVDIQAMALEFKERSYNGLKTSLQIEPAKSNRSRLMTTYHIKTLFREACASGDTQAARFHFEALARLVSQLDTSRSYIENRRVALWGDALSALLQLRRPAVDVFVMLEDVVQGIWTDAEFSLPILTLDSRRPPSSILVKDLQAAFAHLNRTVNIVNHLSKSSGDPDGLRNELIFQWLTTKAEHHICRLLNFYYDEHELGGMTAKEDPLSDGERYIHMSAALALLHIYQKAFFDIYQADGTDIHESAMAILPPLKQALQLAEKHFSRSERHFYRQTVFWIVFVGAWAEQRLKGGIKYSDQPAEHTTWFSVELPKLAKELELTPWSRARSVLDEFAWVSYLDERIESWYAEIVRGGGKTT